MVLLVWFGRSRPERRGCNRLSTRAAEGDDGIFPPPGFVDAESTRNRWGVNAGR